MIKKEINVFIFLMILFFSLTTNLWAKITIYLCGDSTMQDWVSGYYPKQGMGQDFSYFFDNTFVATYNAGRGGTTSQTFYDEHWSQNFTKNGVTYPAVSSLINDGDYVFIMFGANDNGYKTGEVNFKNSIGSMVKQTQTKGAYPVLLSPIRRSNFTNADSVYESYHAYPIFMRQIADSLNVPLIDLDTLSRNLLLSVGAYYSNHYINMFIDAGEYSTFTSAQTDNQHLQQNGANAMGRIVTEQLRVHSDADTKILSNYLVPMYQIDVKVSPEEFDLYTSISAYYPSNMTVTLKTTPNTDKKFLGWYDGNGNKVSENSVSQVQDQHIYTFVMGSASTQYTAVYEGGSAQLYSGDGKALSSFPSNTPKDLNQGSSTPISSSSSSSSIAESSSSVQMIEFKSTFDSFKPDSGIGFSESNNIGFNGEGFWNFQNEMGAFASYNMVFPSAGYASLGIVYANGGTNDRQLNIYLEHDYYVSFPPTGSWTDWDTVYVDLDLMSGDGILEFISMTNDGGPNIDMFGFNLANITRQGDVTSKINDNQSISSSNFINGNILYLAKSGKVLISIFDLHGKQLIKKQMNLSAGINTLPLKEWIPQLGNYYIVAHQKSLTTYSNWLNIN